MFQRIKSIFTLSLPAIIFATFSVGVIIYAWTEPSSPPPITVIDAPLNVGTTSQSKAGNLALNTDCSLANGLLIPCGNVGIGIISPGYKLDVQNGQINAAGGLCIAGVCKTSWDTVTNYWTASGDNIYNNNSGNVGIGATTPGEKLEVNGNIKLSGASPTYKITNVAIPNDASDVATKGYVDAQTGGGGGTCGLYFYQTASTYNGLTADTACQSGYHICFPGEMIGRAYNTTLGVEGALEEFSWIDFNTNATSSTVSDCNNWDSSVSTYYGGAVSVSSASNVTGWIHTYKACNNTYKVLCCQGI